MQQGREVVERALASGADVYGVTTGFGKFARVRIEPRAVRALQRNLLLSHAIGAGPAFATEAVRAMMLLHAASLARGYSGVRPLVVDRLLELLSAGAHPMVPSQGSVGASGDLAPLAHMALPLIDEARSSCRGSVSPVRRRWTVSASSRSSPEAKEGLALVNGIQAMSTVPVLHDTCLLARTADVATASNLRRLFAGPETPPRTPTATRCRTPTRCGRCPRCTGPAVTRRPTWSGRSRWRWRARPAIRSSSPRPER